MGILLPRETTREVTSRIGRPAGVLRLATDFDRRRPGLAGGRMLPARGGRPVVEPSEPGGENTRILMIRVRENGTRRSQFTEFRYGIRVGQLPVCKAAMILHKMLHTYNSVNNICPVATLPRSDILELGLCIISVSM